MTTPLDKKYETRVRVNDCDRSNELRPGALLAICDEARFELYETLAREGANAQIKQAMRAERIERGRAIGSGEALTIEAFLGRVGRTSFDIEQIVTSSTGEVVARISSTAVGLDEKSAATPVDPALGAHTRDALVLEVGKPAELDGSVAFLRTIDALPSHENTGGHVARTRLVDWFVDGYKLGVRRAAFEHEGSNDERRVRKLSLSYEREVFAGDGLRLAIASASAVHFDATLVRGGAVVCRARLEVGD